MAYSRAKPTALTKQHKIREKNCNLSFSLSAGPGDYGLVPALNTSKEEIKDGLKIRGPADSFNVISIGGSTCGKAYWVSCGRSDDTVGFLNSCRCGGLNN